MDTDRDRRVCITGTFDVKNYGDLLFPLIARWRLAPDGIEVVPTSPTSVATGYPDAADPIEIAELLCGDDNVDAVLIGGGQIVHNYGLENLVEDYRENDVAAWAHPSLWLGATLAAALRDVPAIWNAPGVPMPFSKSRRETLVAATLRAASAVSVRDQGSAECLGAPDDVDVHVVPDTAVDLARMWPVATLRSPFQTLVDRKGMDPDANHMVVHVRGRTLGDLSMSALAALIDDFATTRNLTPMFVAIGPSVGDVEIAREIAGHLGRAHVLLDDPISLQEIAAAIAHAKLYIGASLHGCITSAAYNVPAVIVAQPPIRKLGGFLEHIERTDALARDWKSGFEVAGNLLGSAPVQWIPDTVLDKADHHWARVREAIAAPALKRGERAEFLKSYIRLGIGAAGPGWSLQPFMGRNPRRQP